MEITEDVRIEREEMLANLALAFEQRAFNAFETFVRPDMTMTMAGRSRLSGTNYGYVAFERYLHLLRDVAHSVDAPISFEHAGNEMTSHHRCEVHGPQHRVEMAFSVLTRFDEHGRVEAIEVEAEDQGLFDYVVDSASDEAPAREGRRTSTA
jgi:hypothetical protein